LPSKRWKELSPSLSTGTEAKLERPIEIVIRYSFLEVDKAIHQETILKSGHR